MFQLPLRLGICAVVASMGLGGYVRAQATDADVHLVTRQGELVGLGVGDTKVRVFKGIPYAPPPTGPRRWTAAGPAPAWTGVRDARIPGPVCLQFPLPKSLAFGPGKSQAVLYAEPLPGGLCLFFAARAAQVASHSHALYLLTLIIVCALPLAALVLAEGLLRRHAPTLLKALLTLTAIPLAVAILLADGRPPASSWALGGYVVLSLLGVTVLLTTRDRTSLSGQENASVGALIASGAVLTLLSVTDFVPQIPVGLSGAGAAMVAYALSANQSSNREARGTLINLFMIFALAAVVSVPLASLLGMVSLSDKVRLGAIVLAAFLAVSAILDARRRTSRLARGFALALADADTSNLDALMESLADQPLLAGLRLAEGTLVADYDLVELGAAMAPRAVWTPEVLSDPLTPLARRPRDELSDLMARTEATHALLISPAPLRIALLTLPGAGPTDETAANLALFRKLAALAALDRS